MQRRTIPFDRTSLTPAGSRGNGRKAARQARKKTVAKASKPKVPQRRTYDSTLDRTRRPQTEQDTEAAELFEQMKKREF
jgi:hypothetical protein